MRLISLLAMAATSLSIGCAGTREAGRDVKAAVPGLSQKGEGIVQEVKHDQIAVVGITPQNTAVWFLIGPDTEIVRAGQRLQVSDLSDQAIRISYESALGPERAFKIEVLTGGEAAKVRTDVNERATGGAGTNPNHP